MDASSNTRPRRRLPAATPFIREVWRRYRGTRTPADPDVLCCQYARLPHFHVGRMWQGSSKGEAEAQRLTLQYRHDFGLPMSAHERLTLGLMTSKPARNER